MASDSDWMAQGVCNKHPELTVDDFHPDPKAMSIQAYNERVRRAKTICAVCTVRSTCLQFAMDHRIEEGVWGGTSPKERLRLAERKGRREVAS